MESLLEKTVSLHVSNCTKKDATTGVFLWIDLVNTFFLVHFTQASIGTCSAKVGFLKNFRKTASARVFLLDKVAYHEACNFIKKRLQHRCFTVNFAKLLKTLCRTPPVSASNFNSTFLTLRPRKMYVYVFRALFGFCNFSATSCFLIEARNIFIWF